MKRTSIQAAPNRVVLPSWVAAFFLMGSFLISVAFLSVRNIYDDEIGTTNLLLVPTRQIVATMNHTDVHPPGMYVLGHLGYRIIPSARWVTLFPLACLYGGLAVFVLAYAPLFRTAASRLCFLLFATLHPQLLMWGNSIRWYPWWTGLGLLAVVVALNPRASKDAQFRAVRAVTLGLLLGCLFYLNYITILFGVAVASGVAVRYGRRAWKMFLLSVLTAFVLVVPQLRAFLTVHLLGSSGQRSGALLSTARLVHSLFCSEAYLPWHPVAILAALLLLTLAGVGAVAGVRFGRRGGLVSATAEERSLASVVVLALVFLVLVAVSGLGGKPRNGLALVPLLAPAVALAVGSLRARAARVGCIVFLALWSGLGISHLLRREGLTKSGMNNRPEEVLRFIEATRGDRCSVVVTYDPILSFYLMRSLLPRQLVLVASQNTQYRDAVPFSESECRGVGLYVVQSYLGGFGAYESIFPGQLEEAVHFIQLPMQAHAFSYDPDAGMKRRLRFLSGTATLPDYRYVVRSGSILPGDLKALEEHLPYFTVADGRSVPRLP